MWAWVLLSPFCGFLSVVPALSLAATPVPGARFWPEPGAGQEGKDRTGHPALPGLLWEATGSSQVPEPGLAPRPPRRARDAHPSPFWALGHPWGVFPAGKGERGPPQPLTSVSMGSTSIPFHSSSRWAIGMPGESSWGRDRAEGARLGRRRERGKEKEVSGEDGTGTLLTHPPARPAKWLRNAPGSCGGLDKAAADRPVPSLWAAWAPLLIGGESCCGGCCGGRCHGNGSAPPPGRAGPARTPRDRTGAGEAAGKWLCL